MAQAAPMILMAATQFAGSWMEHNALKDAAKVDEENARLAELEGAYEGADIRRRARATQGEAISALAAGGVSVGDGSAQDLLYQNQLEAEYAVMTSRYQASREAFAYRSEAHAKRKQARRTVIGGILGAGAQAITGLSDMRNNANEAAAQQRRQAAFFPGGQRLPMPPSYGGGY